jgi:hypothetical protein
MGAPLKSYQRLDKGMVNGKIIGPELYYPGPLITAPQGHPASTFYTGQHDLITNGTFQVIDLAKAKKEIGLLSSKKVDFIKIVYDGCSALVVPCKKLDVVSSREGIT